MLYFSVYFLIDLLLFISALFFFRKRKKAEASADFEGHSVSILVPAYNEEVSLVDCVEMLLHLDYPDYRVVVINDGSKDQTLQVMLSAFRFGEVEEIREAALKTAGIRSVRKSPDGRLWLVDKENGGKADSINAGINLSADEFVCTIDADSILDREALQQVVAPFLSDSSIFVSGGQLAISNDLVIRDNKVVSSRIPRNLLVLWQIIEYIKSFMVSRLGFSRLGSLLIMSGAFSLYRREDLLEAGGFLTSINDHPYILKTVGRGKKTVCEDMEIVVRLRRLFHEKKQKASTRFLPSPVCWTEVPFKASSLFKQRTRWHTGLAETLRFHSGMMFEPKYRTTGMIALPYYFFFELLAPLMKVFALAFLVIASALGYVNSGWVISLLVGVTLIAAFFTSSVTALIERWSSGYSDTNRQALRYKGFSDWLILILAGILSDFSFAFFRLAAQLKGLWDYLARKSEWNKFERKGIDRSP